MRVCASGMLKSAGEARGEGVAGLTALFKLSRLRQIKSPRRSRPSGSVPRSRYLTYFRQVNSRGRPVVTSEPEDMTPTAPITVTRQPSPSGFLAAARELLSGEEALNSLPLGIADALSRGRRYGKEAPLLLTLERAQTVMGSALRDSAVQSGAVAARARRHRPTGRMAARTRRAAAGRDR